jgi:hypothetical protein
MSRIIKFISQAAMRDGQPFLVRCTCDGLLLAEADGIAVTCETCAREIVPKVVQDKQSVNVRDEETGEWKAHPVQQYSGPLAPWTPRVGDVVGKGQGTERWRIESIEGSQAVVTLLANKKDTGAPIEMHFKEKVPLLVLRYTPD